MINTKEEKYGTLWSRKELILAFELYCRIPFSKTKRTNPAVIELASLIGRTPSSVARKLGNFGSFDPILKQQNISGLIHSSKADATIWEEFNKDWNNLVLEANDIKEKLASENHIIIEKKTKDRFLKRPSGESERIIERKTRVHRTFFREAIITSYEQTCCITGLDIPECLVASHIIPWSVAEEHRTDPRNGLCLSATFDRLFDRGLLTITPQYIIKISDILQKAKNSRTSFITCFS
jgi:putative restriction endonuclease